MSRVGDQLTALDRALAEVLTVEDLGGAPLRCLEAALDAAQSLLYRYGPQRQPMLLGGPLAACAEAYTPEVYAADPLHPFMRGLPARLLVEPDDDVHRRVHRSPAYADFYAEADADHYLGVWPTALPYGAPGMFGVFLSRSARSGPFDAATTRSVRELEPAFGAMARRVRRVARLRRDHGALRAVAEASSSARVGAIAWDLDGRLLARSGAITTWMEGARSSVAELWRVARVFVDGWRRRVGGSARWERSFGGPTADLHASFAVRATEVADPVVLAVVERVPHGLARARTLTPAERRVLGALARGRRNRDIAEAFGISIDTVKTHVKRVLAKLQVRSRSEAALIGAQLDEG